MFAAGMCCHYYDPPVELVDEYKGIIFEHVLKKSSENANKEGVELGVVCVKTKLIYCVCGTTAQQLREPR